MMLVVPTFDASAAHFIVCKPRKYLLTARLVLEQRLFFVGSVPFAVVGRLAGFAVRALGAGTAFGTLPHWPTFLLVVSGSGGRLQRQRTQPRPIAPRRIIEPRRILSEKVTYGKSIDGRREQHDVERHAHPLCEVA